MRNQSRRESTEWMEDASCLGVHVDLFFSKGKPDPEVIKLCADCPVRDICLAEAMREERGNSWDRWGIRGGLTAGQRRDLAKGLKS